jgi:hypothetical protein
MATADLRIPTRSVGRRHYADGDRGSHPRRRYDRSQHRRRISQGVGQYDQGLGVTNSYTDNSHTVDASGLSDILLFSFDTIVRPQSIKFGYVDSDDEFEFWFDDLSDGSLDDDFVFSADIPSDLTYEFTTVYEGDLFGIAATYYEVVWVYEGGGWKKKKKKKELYADFKVKKIVVREPPPPDIPPPSAVPLPASLPLFASGAVIIGLIGAARGRKEPAA